MGAALLPVDVGGEVVPPAQQRGLEFKHRRARRSEGDVVERPVLETVGGPDRKWPRERAEPEERGVEEMRSEVREDSGAPVAPGRVANVARRAVAVKHPAEVDLPEDARLDGLFHPDEMRLESVVVGRVADDPRLGGAGGEPLERRLGGGEQRLFHQDVLPVGQQVVEDVHLDVVGRADEGRFVGVQRHLLHRGVLRAPINRVRGGDHVRPGDGQALPPLDAEADDDHPHRGGLSLSTLPS